MKSGKHLLRLRGHNRPHLLDWNRDGRTDLVLEDSYLREAWWDLQVGVGPLRGKTEVEVEPFRLPALPDRDPDDFEFADWDGDGLYDVLMAGAYLEDQKNGPWLYDIYWFRNTSRRGKPRFEPPVRLLTAPVQSPEWQYTGYAVVDRGRAGRQDLVVSVHKGWDNKGGRWTQTGRLWLFRRRAEADGMLTTGPFSMARTDQIDAVPEEPTVGQHHRSSAHTLARQMKPGRAGEV
jgi:hypothetical protein